MLRRLLCLGVLFLFPSRQLFVFLSPLGLGITKAYSPWIFTFRANVFLFLLIGISSPRRILMSPFARRPPPSQEGGIGGRKATLEGCLLLLLRTPHPTYRGGPSWHPYLSYSPTPNTIDSIRRGHQNQAGLSEFRIRVWDLTMLAN